MQAVMFVVNGRKAYCVDGKAHLVCNAYLSAPRSTFERKGLRVEYEEWSTERCDGSCQREDGAVPPELEAPVQEFLSNGRGKLWGLYYHTDGTVEVE